MKKLINFFLISLVIFTILTITSYAAGESTGGGGGGDAGGGGGDAGGGGGYLNANVTNGILTQGTSSTSINEVGPPNTEDPNYINLAGYSGN